MSDQVSQEQGASVALECGSLQSASPLVHQSLGVTNRQARELARSVSDGDMVLDAPYQRGSVWSVTQRRNLVRSWLLGLPVPAVILNARWEHMGDRTDPGFAVVDGKQRIETAVVWFAGQLAVPASWFDPSWVASTVASEDGPYVTCTHLTEQGRRLSSSRFMLPVAMCSVATVAQEAVIFGLVNGAGTAQSDVDMAQAARVAQSGK